ncbi:MAG TPA: DNA alkylation repair protein [Planctomycetota bacterium]|nr:DNA alkylation repair protein [Planctomycetota bacterium]
MAALERLASQKTRDGMARYAIPADKALGVAVGDLRRLAKSIGRDPALAAALWETDVYEARMLACFVDDSEAVTPAQMKRWASGFDSWAICDTACFHLFDRTAQAFEMVDFWAGRKPEFERRAAFALLASLAGHDRTAADAAFSRRLPLIERAATDDRNFVKKGVSWALRGVGRRSPDLHAACVALAERLAASPAAAARWVGKDALRDLTKPAVLKRLQAKRARSR